MDPAPPRPHARGSGPAGAERRSRGFTSLVWSPKGSCGIETRGAPGCSRISGLFPSARPAMKPISMNRQSEIAPLRRMRQEGGVPRPVSASRIQIAVVESVPSPVARFTRHGVGPAGLSARACSAWPRTAQPPGAACGVGRWSVDSIVERVSQRPVARLLPQQACPANAARMRCAPRRDLAPGALGPPEVGAVALGLPEAVPDADRPAPAGARAVRRT